MQEEQADARVVESQQGRVLDGLRVIEIGHFIAAPFGARVLADLGADLIKVEPLDGDPVRQWGEQPDGRSLWWSVHGRNKRCVTLDLKSAEGRALLLDLVEKSDALIENFRPGQLEKLGLGPDVLHARNPGLVIARVSGYGQNGPYRDRAAFGVIGEAMGGLRYLSNQPPGPDQPPPVRVGVSIGDSIAGLYAAFGIMAAVWQRDRAKGDGKARTLDVALTESMFSMMEGMLPEYGRLGKIKQPTGGGIATAAPTNAYPTADGEWVLIAGNSEPIFGRLATLIGMPDLPRDPRFAGNAARVANVVALDALIAGWTVRHDAAEAIELLKGADVPSSKIYTVADCATDPQYLERDMVREIEDPLLGPILHPGIVPYVPGDAASIRWTGPEIGAHNDEIYGELLGRSPEQLDALRAAGAI
ncbi:crotonobetainyl-CoA:carnitine CoA-transferase CaiB-like acyl-CoA transferase [Hephaestia caeni]|uniref:Crotonobetainyl-CoA:carnitine CoA-transferase CaiB-like acyl-CoA transferase n=1 Tax=Hephaestia caeni TaxID=645617 RepID=A0A397NKI2_9SPHN|nr:CoA transferase [Hephaestia caeni]RIA37976.1 crotonobetainyl-CoA:carnitine CoA-transferase CaiB-like acyl-CoA transferase [Hephaestia caeni]